MNTVSEGELLKALNAITPFIVQEVFKIARRLTNKMQHKILIRQRSITTDDLSQQIETFIDYGIYWAMVRTLRGNEIMSSSTEKIENCAICC